MNRTFRWAVIGPGSIAHRFAEAVTQLDGNRLAGVWARDAAKAQVFANAWQQPDADAIAVFADMQEMLASDSIDAVYIATPHSHHGAPVRASLRAGKPVLCEKPLVPTHAEFQSLAQLAQERNVFLMEALWTRFLPIYAVVQRWLQDGAIGELQAVESSFCFDVPYQPAHRMFDPALAGGTLLDIGIYNLAMTRWVLESAWGACPEPEHIDVSGTLAPSGVDQRVDATFAFPRGVRAHFVCAFDRSGDNTLRVDGSAGVITVLRDFWGGHSAQLVRPGQPPVEVSAPFAINGFEYQIEEVVRCVRAGKTQSAVMPLAETGALLRWIDGLRARLGVVYPFE